MITDSIKKYLLLTLVLFILLSGISSAQQVSIDVSFYIPPTDIAPLPEIEKNKVKNIILFIGDGMGLAQLNAARIRAVGTSGKLYIEKMPVTGIKRTHAANNLITDSAASGTALACGIKTNNGMIAMAPDGTKYKSILEVAKQKGMSTGLIATSSITHATPATFASHVRYRGNEVTIAEQLIKNKVNLLLGGGKQFFIPQSVKWSARKDNRNLIEEAKKLGYNYIETAGELKSADNKYILGLFQMGEMTTEYPEPSLYDFTEKSIELLSRNETGFFLMVEGSQIDWACHENNPDRSIRQILLFDMAVKSGLDFAVKDKHTLVIVTADHETGGLAINGGSLDGNKLFIGWTTRGHSGVPVPVYAFGPYAEKFTGVYDNTDLPKILAKLLNIENFPQILE